MSTLRIYSRVLMFWFKTMNQEDYWAWLYKRVSDANSTDYRNRALLWHLLDLAIQEDEHLRVVTLYHYFQDIFDEDITDFYKEKVVQSIDAAERLK